MTLYTDIPTRAEIDALWSAAFPTSVSLYVPTEPASSGDAERIAFRNLARAALDQLAGADKDDLAAVEEALADLGEDDGFWRRQARTLAVFATPAWSRTFRLPNRLVELAAGGQRLYVKPLMRAVTFPQTAFVLALAQGGVRLLETVPDAPPVLVRVPDMPHDVASAAGKASIKDRAPVRRLQGDEGQKVRIRQYARRVDQALREVLPGHGVPLVIAATEPLDSIFRSVSRYPDVVPDSVSGNPESVSDVELVQQARAVLDRYYAGKLAELHALFERRAGQNRTSTDVATVARLVTRGAVDTLFFDIDGVLPGEVDEDGAVRFGTERDPGSTGVVDEITRRAWLSGARLLAVRRHDVPGGGDLAAVLRYPT
jgi:Bacterial archaeo-eukaryotic release factor family 11